MKWILRVVIGLVALIAAVFLLQLAASESGEVVELTTVDAAGEAHVTRLWVVEHDDAWWLRSGADVAGWYQRLVASPEVTVVRGDQTLTMLAFAELGARDAINAKMREKYGWADQVIDVMFGREDAIAIRLTPLGSSVNLQAEPSEQQ